MVFSTPQLQVNWACLHSSSSILRSYPQPLCAGTAQSSAWVGCSRGHRLFDVSWFAGQNRCPPGPSPAVGCAASVLILFVGSGKWEARKQNLTSKNQGEKGHWGFQSCPCPLTHWVPSLTEQPVPCSSVFLLLLMHLQKPCLLPFSFLYASPVPLYSSWNALCVLTCSHLSSGVAYLSVQASGHIILVFCTVQFLCASKRLS